MSDPCESLPGRLGSICRGETDVPDDYRLAVLQNLHRTGRFSDAAMDALGLSPAQEATPSVIQRAKSFGRAVGRTAKRAATGKPVTVTADVLAARKAACESCDKADAGWCRKCGCVLAAKQRLATETCPLGRWPTVP